MRFKSIVTYKRALAHYEVESSDVATFIARLLRYDGRPQVQPPNRLEIRKDQTGAKLPVDRLKRELLTIIKEKVAKLEKEAKQLS